MEAVLTGFFRLPWLFFILILNKTMRSGGAAAKKAVIVNALEKKPMLLFNTAAQCRSGPRSGHAVVLHRRRTAHFMCGQAKPDPQSGHRFEGVPTILKLSKGTLRFCRKILWNRQNQKTCLKIRQVFFMPVS